MAVVIQKIVGNRYGDYFYPSISGVAQSMNYYPFSKMQPEEGIASIALGFGKSVMEGEKILRFSPRFRQIVPQRSTVDNILTNSQRFFYALKMRTPARAMGIHSDETLSKRNVTDAVDEHPVQLCSSSYVHAEHRIRDSFSPTDYPVVTFASILKYNALPLAEMINALLSLGQKKLDCPVELGFALDIPTNPEKKAKLAIFSQPDRAGHQLP